MSWRNLQPASIFHSAAVESGGDRIQWERFGDWTIERNLQWKQKLHVRATIERREGSRSRLLTEEIEERSSRLEAAVPQSQGDLVIATVYQNDRHTNSASRPLRCAYETSLTTRTVIVPRRGQHLAMIAPVARSRVLCLTESCSLPATHKTTERQASIPRLRTRISGEPRLCASADPQICPSSGVCSCTRASYHVTRRGNQS